MNFIFIVFIVYCVALLLAQLFSDCHTIGHRTRRRCLALFCMKLKKSPNPLAHMTATCYHDLTLYTMLEKSLHLAQFTDGHLLAGRLAHGWRSEVEASSEVGCFAGVPFIVPQSTQSVSKRWLELVAGAGDYQLHSRRSTHRHARSPGEPSRGFAFGRGGASTSLLLICS